MPSLADKLKALGVKVGTADLTPPKPASTIPIHTIVPGEYRQTARGEAFVSEQTFGADYRHGVQPLTINHPLETIATWARDPLLSSFPLSSFLYPLTFTALGPTNTLACHRSCTGVRS